MFRLQEAGFRYGEARVLSDITCDLAGPGLIAIAGPNGAGKSTLLNILAGLHRRYDGAALFNGQRIERWDRAAYARSVGYVPQAVRVDFPFTVEQVVLMGRTPHGDGLFESEEDRRAAAEAMAEADIVHLAARDFRALSGGERQRVILASALAQGSGVLLLDEPTTFLDVKHQIAIYRLMRDQATAGKLIVAVTHDLNLAATYADRVIVLQGGRIVADGSPLAVIRPELLARVFEVDVTTRVAADGTPRIEYGR